MYDLTGFQRDLLYVVNGLDEPHGLTMKEELETTTTKKSTTGDCIQTWILLSTKD